MRVRHLHLDKQVAIAFHPYLTVVAGLDPRQRVAVADAVAERSVQHEQERDAAGEPLSLAEAAHADQVRAELAAAEQAARRTRLVPDPTLVAVLEEAHQQVEAAEAGAGRILAGRRSRRRLQAARRAEREVLDRLGYASYNEVILARAAPALDLAAEERLLAARDAVAAVRAVPTLLHDHRRTALPMVVDDTFVDLDGDDVEPVVRQLAEWSPVVQIIWLSDDPAVARVAESLGPDRAAVVRAGRSTVAPTV